MLRNIPPFFNIYFAWCFRSMWTLHRATTITSSAATVICNCYKNKTAMQTLCFSRNVRLQCASTKPDPEIRVQSKRRFPKPGKPAQFIERSVTFLRTSPLYEETTFRLTGVNTIDSWGGVPSLEEKMSSIVMNAKREFSSKDYIECFRLPFPVSSNETRDFLRLGESNIQKFNKKELTELLKVLCTRKLNFKLYMAHFINTLDRECCRRITMWDVESCLLCIDMWYFMDDHKFVNRKFWKILLQECDAKLADMSLQNVVQLLFYVGVAKSAPVALLSKFETKVDRQINSALSEELGIVCDSFFKNKYQLTLPAILCAVRAEAKKIMLSELNPNRFSLIRLLKTLRHAQQIDDDLSCLLVSWLKTGALHKCNIVECAHLFATLATAKIYDVALFNLMETILLRTLNNENELLSTADKKSTFHMHPTQKSRPKDVARILWSLSEMSHEVQNEDVVNTLVRHLEICFECGYFATKPHILLDSLLSLAILNVYPAKLINYIFSSKTCNQLLSLGRDKPLKQLYTLNQIVALERPSYKSNCLVSQHSLGVIPSLDKELQSRPVLQVIADMLKEVVGCNSIRALRVLPYINIAGFVLKLDSSRKKLMSFSLDLGSLPLYKLNDNIIVDLLGRETRKLLDPPSSTDKKPEFSSKDCVWIAVEILDSATVVKGTGQPIGMMNVKIRHLNILKYKVVVIAPDQLQQMLNKERKTSIMALQNLVMQVV